MNAFPSDVAPRRWQFTIGDSLLTMATFAVFLAYRNRLDRPVINVVTWIVAAAVIVNVFLAPAAWRNLRSRTGNSAGQAGSLRREKYAFATALLALLTNIALSAGMSLAQPVYQSTWLDDLGLALFVTGAMFQVPIALLLLAYLFVYWGFRENPPLLVMRVFSFLVSCTLIVGTVYLGAIS